MVCRLVKLKPTKANDVGFHSAAQVSENQEARLKLKVEKNITALAIAVKNLINLAIGEVNKIPAPSAAALIKNTTNTPRLPTPARLLSALSSPSSPSSSTS